MTKFEKTSSFTRRSVLLGGGALDTNGGHPWDTLAGQTQGVALKSGDGFAVPAESIGSAI